MRDLNLYGKSYQKGFFETEYQVLYRRRLVLEILSKYSHKHILEVGCGLGSIANYINDYETITIIEPCEVFLQAAEQELGVKNNVKFMQNYFEDVIDCLKKEQFDFIIISSLLHEVQNPYLFMNKVAELCQSLETIPVIHINTPNAYSLHRLLAFESGIIENVHEHSVKNKELQQKSVFSLEELKEVITSENKEMRVSILESGSYFIKPFTHDQMEKCLNYGILNKEILDGFNKIEKYMEGLGSEIYINYSYKKKNAKE